MLCKSSYKKTRKMVNWGHLDIDCIGLSGSFQIALRGMVNLGLKSSEHKLKMNSVTDGIYLPVERCQLMSTMGIYCYLLSLLIRSFIFPGFSHPTPNLGILSAAIEKRLILWLSWEWLNRHILLDLYYMLPKGLCECSLSVTQWCYVPVVCSVVVCVECVVTRFCGV